MFFIRDPFAPLVDPCKPSQARATKVHLRCKWLTQKKTFHGSEKWFHSGNTFTVEKSNKSQGVYEHSKIQLDFLTQKLAVCQQQAALHNYKFELKSDDYKEFPEAMNLLLLPTNSLGLDACFSLSTSRFLPLLRSLPRCQQSSGNSDFVTQITNFLGPQQRSLNF